MHDKDMTTEGIAARSLNLTIDLIEGLLNGETINHPALMANAHEQFEKLKRANDRVQSEVNAKKNH